MQKNSNIQFSKIGLFLLVFVCFVFSFVKAQNVQFHLLNSSENEALIQVDFPSYQTIAVDVNGQTMYRLQMKDAYPLLKANSPELMQTSTSLIVPEGSVISTEIVNVDYQLVQNFELAPSKGRLLRNVNPADIAYLKGADYYHDGFLFNNAVSVGEEYQLRDFHGVAVHFYPFDYNPMQKELKVYSSITVRVHFESNQAVKTLRKVSKAYNQIYSDHFLNYNAMKSQPLQENGRILILAPQSFCAAMQPYADWKIRNGYPTEIVSLSTAGSSSATIKNYIASYYASHSDFTFLVMVGDDGQFPTISAGGNISDNYYGEIAGNDVYPDLLIGKISAETEAQVTTQVQKFIQYEKNPVETAHFPVYCGIASNQGPGDDNEYDYTHIRNIGTKLTNYTYTSGYELFEDNQGGLDASGDPTASTVASAVNAGVGIINYCGHGAETYWVTSNFSVTNVNNLTNSNKLPFIISVACVNGAYTNRTCFAEAWLRATKNDQPTGAVGALMSTINQPWNSPMCAQDHINDILTGISSVSQKYTYGGIVFNGFIKMLDEYNDYEVTRTWILFGDPALMVRTAVPQELPLTYQQQVPMGSSSIVFSSTVNGAKVTLTNNHEILSSGLINNGSVTLNIPQNLQPSDTIFVLATAHNYLPYDGIAQVIPVNGPYLVCNSVTLGDYEALSEANNHDGLADYGETIYAEIEFKNVGNEASGPVSWDVTTDDPYVSVLSSNLSINDLAVNSTASATAFTMVVANVVPAAHTAVINLHLTYHGETKTLPINVLLHAPQLAIGDYIVDDAQLGNGNGKLDFNETAILKLNLGNTGNGAARSGAVHVTSKDGKLHLFRLPYETPVVPADGSANVSMRVSVDPQVTAPTVAVLRAVYVVGDYRETKDLYVKIGFQAEDWETGDFSQFNWNNNSQKPWTITSQNPYEGNYAAKSGAIGNNASSILTISHYSANADSISFYYKVSSEDNYDFLKFYIDGSVRDSWSGEVSWTRAAYPVSAGQHTYKWEYVKDYYMTGGSDMAMIDYIELPISNASTSVETYVVENVSVYPNPTTDKVSVTLSEELVSGDCVCQLYDLTGRMLQSVKINSNTTVLNMQEYAQGLYLLEIYNNGQLLQTVKITRQ